MKLKFMLEQRYSLQESDIDAVLVDVPSKKEFKEKIESIKLQKNILAVISAFNPEDDSILYISTSDIFSKEKVTELNNKVASIKNLKTIHNMSAVIEKNIDIDVPKYIVSFQKLYLKLFGMGILLSEDIILGLALHLACTIESVLKRKKATHTSADLEKVINENLEKFKLTKGAVAVMEGDFALKFSDAEHVNIMRIIFSF